MLTLLAAAPAPAVCAEGPLQTVTLQFRATHRYLNFPVRIGGVSHVGAISVDGETKRAFEVQLADGNPDWWAPEDISIWRGKTVTLTLDRLPAGSQIPSLIDQSDAPRLSRDFHHEAFRPRFHYSAPYGFELDVENSCFFEGWYHLFYCWSNLSNKQGSSIWGHAVSKDLAHWRDAAIAWPDQDMWSGSAIIDANNTSGLGRNGRPPMIFIYTRPGKAATSDARPGEQCLAYSDDGGRTVNAYPGNPIVHKLQDSFGPNGPNRDPKVFWYAPKHEWVMILYVAMPGGALLPDGKTDDQHNTFQFLTSPNLLQWKQTGCSIPGFAECPDFYELPVDGNEANEKWVLYSAGGQYRIGSFDGERFTPETPRLANTRGIVYAGSSFSDLPPGDGRRIKMIWTTAPAPTMPFNNHISLPMAQTLRTTPAGLRLFSWPAREVDQLHTGAPFSMENQVLSEGEDPLANLAREGVDIDLDIDLLKAAGLDLIVEGMPIHIDTARRLLTCKSKDSPYEYQAELMPENGRLHLRVFSDKTSLEIYTGPVYIAVPNLAAPWSKPRLGLRALGGPVKINSLRIWSMQSIWD